MTPPEDSENEGFICDECLNEIVENDGDLCERCARENNEDIRLSAIPLGGY